MGIADLEGKLPRKYGWVSAEDLWRAVNLVEPSLIRVEADEATYNLHIMIRYEVEKRLIAGEIEVDDLPDVWDDMYEEFLGIRAPNRTLGVLQDIHWSMGAFGYFPTYTLGEPLRSSTSCQGTRRSSRS